MNVKWTDQQTQAITAKNGPFLVSAAAGSGKTAVLVERLLRVISDEENKTPADKIIVATFTNDAASQMKRKLNAALSDALNADPNNIWLGEQQSLLSAAKISTVHSLCFDLIRENVETLHVSDGFRVLDESENTALLSEALENVLETLYENTPQTMEFLCDFFSKQKLGDERLSQNILCLYDFLQSVPFYNEWLLNCINGDFQDVLLNEYLNLRHDSFERCLIYCNATLRMCENLEGIPTKAYDVINKEKLFFETALENISNSELEWNERTSIQEFLFERFPNKSKNFDDVDDWEQIKNLRNEYKKTYAKSQEAAFTKEDIADDLSIITDVLKSFSRIIDLLDVELLRMKSELNALSFSDAEQLAVKLLARIDMDGNIAKTPLANELSEYYKVIMVDEFQDTNNTQSVIFNMLSNGKNLFLVGDIKQSIYRFRLANPKLFSALLDDEKYNKILLNKNFRSSNDVIEFVNFCFERLMSKQFGSVDYGNDEALVLGAKYPDGINRRTEFVYVTPSVIEEENSVEDTHDMDENETDTDETEEETFTPSDVAEALGTAKKIAEMLQADGVYSDGCMRKCQPKDFLILLRNNAAQKLYIDALTLYNIPAFGANPQGYLKAYEINALISLLKIIDNPLLDLPLVTVLRSSMFSFDDDDLARLRVLSRTMPMKEKTPFYIVLKAVVNENIIAKDDELYSKSECFLNVYKTLKTKSASQSLDRLIRTIYDSTDFLSLVSVKKDGEQKKANLRLLLLYAKEYEENSQGGLTGFLRYLGNMSEKGGDLASPSVTSEANNTVSVKTIHRSKGLEYPFVFLCGTAKKFNLKDTGLSLVYNIDFGLGFTILNRKNLQCYDSFQKAVIRAKNKSEMLSEEMRLLYVALTRAKERIFITLCNDEKTQKLNNKVKGELQIFGVSNTGKIPPQIVMSANSMLEWLMFIAVSEPPANVVNIASDDVSENTVETFVEPDTQLTDSLKNRFLFEYDNTLSVTPAKVTITEIAKQEQSEKQERRPLMRPFFYDGKSKMSAAQKGTAMHAFMQYADFSNAEHDVKLEAERLYSNGILSRTQTDSLDFERLEIFFKSGLYGNVKQADCVWREERFLVDVSELALDDELKAEFSAGMLQGIADLFFERDNKITLVDYKTDRVKNGDELIERYGRQLKLYAAAIEKIYGKNVHKMCIYSFALSIEISIE